MEKVQLGTQLEVSRFALGFWRLMNWHMSTAELESLVDTSLEMGITLFDHADIYGEYRCEEAFGKLLRIKPSLRDNFQLVTKCGIKLATAKFPGQKINHYDTSYEHIIRSAEESLVNLSTDHIDLLLIHRPDPLMNPEETAKAFFQLKTSGKVLNFGVSNFTPVQFEMLNKYFGGLLVTNQVEYSPYCLEHFQNGNRDFFLKQRIHPMGWSPMAGGMLLKPADDKGKRLYKKLREIGKDLGTEKIDEVIYAWILYHPAKVIPIIGSGKPERLKSAAASMKLKMTREQWYEIYIASQGYPLP
jgi:predicted oxidoreductase